MQDVCPEPLSARGLFVATMSHIVSHSYDFFSNFGMLMESLDDDPVKGDCLRLAPQATRATMRWISIEMLDFDVHSSITLAPTSDQQSYSQDHCSHIYRHLAGPIETFTAPVRIGQKQFNHRQ